MSFQPGPDLARIVQVQQQHFAKLRAHGQGLLIGTDGQGPQRQARVNAAIRQRGLTPSYTEWHPQPGHADEPKVLVISPDGHDGSATIHQDAEVYRLRLKPGQSASHELRPGRGAWLQIATGKAALNGVALATGDGASSEEPGVLTLTASEPTEALLFDLA